MRVRAILCLLLVACLWSGRLRCAANEPDASADLFEFHSGFWVNLHHFLYRQAQLAEAGKVPHRVTQTPVDAEEMHKLSAAERDAWNEAVAYYRHSVISHDLLFDDQLIAVKEQLEDAEGSSDLANAKIPAELKGALLKAAPIYRKHWWARHDAENRAWIAQLQPLVQRYGSDLCAQMVRIYGEPWPQFPVRVDAVAYANWAGAYTTVEPTRAAISTSDPANQGAAALEIVFHETSHGMMGKVMDAMRSAEARVDQHRSGAAYHGGSLWHGVLFYTAGELVAERIPGYVPYADKNGLWRRAWSDPDRSLIEQDWKPHISGSVELQPSLTKLVSDLANATQTH